MSSQDDTTVGAGNAEERGFFERLRAYFSPREIVDTSPKISDEVKYTTCYMCACRCGIKVHLKDGGIRYIEGNRDHPVNRGVICGKGASGIMQQYSPAKLRKPLKRVGERGIRRISRDRVGRGDRDRGRMAGADPRRRPEKARLLHRPRPEPGADRLLGGAVRHPQFRRPWRVLLGQHGGGRHVHDRRQLLGIRRARLGAHPVSDDVRRRRGP